MATEEVRVEQFDCGVRVQHIASPTTRSPKTVCFTHPGVEPVSPGASSSHSRGQPSRLQHGDTQHDLMERERARNKRCEQDQRELQHLAEQRVRKQNREQLRKDLRKLQDAVALRQDLLDEEIKKGNAKPPPTFRAGHLRALPDFVGQPPAHSWKTEWHALRTEHHEIEKPGEQVTTETVEEMLERFHEAIAALKSLGWKEKHAHAYSLISACRAPLARALSEKKTRYAASTYALSEALWWAPKRNEDEPIKMYFHREGPLSLKAAEPQWAELEEPDAAGFKGVISHAPTRVLCREDSFSERGFRYKVLSEGIKDMPGDIICFESRPDDEHGAHSVIRLDEKGQSGAL